MAAKKKYALKRTLGLFQVTVAGVGIILGAGIYALIGIASRDAGNAVWLSFLISAVVAAFTGLSYAELSTLFKGDAGEYDYTKKAFNKKLAWFITMAIIFTGIVSASAVSLGFAGYFSKLTGFSYLYSALALIILMSWLNFRGIDDSSRFNTVATMIEFAGLIIILFIGLKHVGEVDLFETSSKGLFGVFQAGALVFFAFMGFETIVKLNEETINPTKTIPRALLLAIVISAILYITVAIAAISVIPYQTLSQSKSPLADVAAVAFGSWAFILLGIIALFSTSNTVLMTVVTTSRLSYGMAKEKSLPKFLSFVHKVHRTPYWSILLVGLATLIFALVENIELVADITTLFLFITFAIVNLSNIFLRYKDKRKRNFRVPLNIGKFPVLSALGVITALIMLYFSIINFF
ncbi:MAG TPA: APC family permease [Candidatus Nanoarchaeia archaeon]|nr:APC family permease [Candidatus Nanoarchaeia archaeon]